MADLAEQKLLVVCGPTASGKSGLGVELALRLGGEILSADSMQIYRGLDIGTAKVTAQEACGVPHHLVDICSPEDFFSVADYVGLAGQTIREIASRDRLPIVVGGTGLYISSLLQGLQFADQPPVEEARRRLEEQTAGLSPEELWQRLNAVDPACAAAVHPHNRKRVLRALELFEQTGRTMSQQVAASHPARPPYRALVVGLCAADRTVLYERIERRVDAMLDAGLLAEARRVYDNRSRFVTAAQAIGYKEFFPYFENAAPLQQCVQQLKTASRHYAKRQLTWFGRMPQVHWLQIDRCDDLPAAACALMQEEGDWNGD